MTNRKTLDERIAAAKLEAEQKQNRLKLLLQEQKKAERKARNHRLCERGGKVESRLPRLALLSDEQFDVWMKKTLLSGFAEKVLNEILPPSADTANSGDAVAQSAEVVKTAQPPIAHSSGKMGDAARVAG